VNGIGKTATGVNVTEGEKSDPLLEEALDWLLRLQGAPSDVDSARQFETWRSRSPDHERAWAKACRTWELMGEVPPVYEHLWSAKGRGQRRQSGNSRHPSGGAFWPRQWSWKRRIALGATAAVFAISLVIAVPAILIRIQADYVTTTGENRLVSLADGSKITLGADSAIASRFTDDVRRIILLSGEAFFEAAPDSSRPFVVESGGVDVTVFGTEFNVQLSTATTTVELATGSVRIDWEQAGSRIDTALSAGEMAFVDRGTGVMKKRAIAPSDIGAWRSGQLFVQDETIGSVVEQLQRYHSAWISVPDSYLATQRVTGLYDLRDPDRALRALVQPYAGHVRDVSPYLRVISRL
jgi:transmembrane sensor